MPSVSPGPGTFTARVMLSFEPGTVTERRYPELFQQGETAFGKPIVDGQHPHDFIMELAALYDLKLSENGLLGLYFASTGDRAMGPTPYPHRGSASEDPMAPLGHHLQVRKPPGRGCGIPSRAANRQAALRWIRVSILTTFTWTERALRSRRFPVGAHRFL